MRTDRYDLGDINTVAERFEHNEIEGRAVITPYVGRSAFAPTTDLAIRAIDVSNHQFRALFPVHMSLHGRPHTAVATGSEARGRRRRELMTGGGERSIMDETDDVGVDADSVVHVLDRGRIHADMNYVIDGYAMASADDPNPDHEYAEFCVWNLLIDISEEMILWNTGPYPEAEE